MKITGVILDVAGIQNYIFGTSQLRQNAAASFIVDHVISVKMFNEILTGFPGIHVLEQWVDKPDIVQIGENGVTVETAYVGGGNAILFFQDRSEAEEFGRQWSLKVLAEFPGLTPVVALYEGEFDKDKDKDWFADFRDGCRRELAKTRSQTITITDLPRHGVTAECIYTGRSAQVYDTDIPGLAVEKKYLSRSVLVKAEWFHKAHTHWQKKFLEHLNLEFPRDFHEIAGETTSERKSALAVVHIDGNDIGKRFREVNTLEDYRRESCQIGRWMETSLKKGIGHLANAVEQFQKDGDGKSADKESKSTLPFRPIIIGGDDITFVCRADLGVWLTEIILGALTEAQTGIKDPITACAGIAIIKPSYPFHQGYELAEALCSNAKAQSRGVPNSHLHWLDFHILKGGTFASLEDIRQTVYMHRGKALTGRPFALGKSQEGWGICRNSLRKLYQENWSSSDIKAWRSTIYESKNDLNVLMKRFERKKKSLPDLNPKNARPELGIPEPLDIIELMDIYPEPLLNMEL